VYGLERGRAPQRALAQLRVCVRRGEVPVSESATPARIRRGGANPDGCTSHDRLPLLPRPYGLVDLPCFRSGPRVMVMLATRSIARGVFNGAVRDLAAVGALGFHCFAGNVAMSHSYAHIIEFGELVEIGGLKIESRELIHGDRHGVHAIPPEIATDVPAEAFRVLTEERKLIESCCSPQFRSKHSRSTCRDLPEAVISLRGIDTFCQSRSANSTTGWPRICRAEANESKNE